jgi:hypothetical protein
MRLTPTGHSPWAGAEDELAQTWRQTFSVPALWCAQDAAVLLTNENERRLMRRLDTIRRGARRRTDKAMVLAGTGSGKSALWAERLSPFAAYDSVKDLVSEAEAWGFVSTAAHGDVLLDSIRVVTSEVLAIEMEATTRDAWAPLMTMYDLALDRADLLWLVLRVQKRDRVFELALKVWVGTPPDESDLPIERPDMKVAVPDGPARALPRESRAGPAREGTASSSPDGDAKHHADAAEATA